MPSVSTSPAKAPPGCFFLRQRNQPGQRRVAIALRFASELNCRQTNAPPERPPNIQHPATAAHNHTPLSTRRPDPNVPEPRRSRHIAGGERSVRDERRPGINACLRVRRFLPLRSGRLRRGGAYRECDGRRRGRGDHGATPKRATSSPMPAGSRRSCVREGASSER